MHAAIVSGVLKNSLSDLTSVSSIPSTKGNPSEQRKLMWLFLTNDEHSMPTFSTWLTLPIFVYFVALGRPWKAEFETKHRGKYLYSKFRVWWRQRRIVLEETSGVRQDKRNKSRVCNQMCIASIKEMYEKSSEWPQIGGICVSLNPPVNFGMKKRNVCNCRHKDDYQNPECTTP